MCLLITLLGFSFVSSSTSASSDTVLVSRIAYSDAEGHPVYLLAPDGPTPFVQDFDDFLFFVQAFGSTSSSSNYIVAADVDDNGKVEFTDFLNFASGHNRVAAFRNGVPLDAASVAPNLFTRGQK